MPERGVSMQRWKNTHNRTHISLLITLLVLASILFVSTACDQGSCQPQAPYLQLHVTGGMVSVTSSNPGLYSASILRGSDGKQLRHVDNTDRQLADNGVVYIGEDTSIVAQQASDGKQLWQFSGSESRSQPMTVVDGVLYAMGNTTLYAIRASDGTALWQFQPKSSTGQLEVTNGMVYVGNNSIFALRASDGTLAWQFLPPNGEQAFQAFKVDNGVLYTIVNYSALYALQANDGKQLWRFQPTHIASWGPESLTIVNGVIYLQCSSAIFAIQANNAKLLWHFDSTTFVESYEAANGVVYIRLLNGITALRAKDAKELWTFHSDVQGLVVDKGDAALYTRVSSGQVVALRLSNGSLLWRASVDNVPQVVNSGTLYLATGKGGCTANTAPYGEVAAIQVIDGKVLWQSHLS
jgi:outer membrane protein assembly factor BamB